jgi:hypothetical protein
MFRVSFMVKDKWLSDVLLAINGKCGNLEVQPVSLQTNQSAISLKKIRKAGSGRNQGRSHQMDALFDSLPEEFGYKDSTEAFRAAGASNSSFWKRLNSGLVAGTIVKLGPGRYRKITKAA